MEQELRRLADQAQEWADRTSSDRLKAGWNRIAQGWRTILAHLQQSALSPLQNRHK